MVGRSVLWVLWPRPPRAPRLPVHLKGSTDTSAPPPLRPWGGISSSVSAAAAAAGPAPRPTRPADPGTTPPAPPVRPRGGMRRRGAQDAPQPRDAPQTRQVHPSGYCRRAVDRLQHPVLRVHVSPPRRPGRRGHSPARRGRDRGPGPGTEGRSGQGWHPGFGQSEPPLWAEAVNVPILGTRKR